MAWMTFLLFIVHASAKCTKSGEGPDGKGGCSACPVWITREEGIDRHLTNILYGREYSLKELGKTHVMDTAVMFC